MRISATIPGKLILLGEYAVLHNAPALVAAIDRYLRITVKRVSGDKCILKLPHLGAEVLFQTKDGQAQPLVEQPVQSAAIDNLFALLNSLIKKESRSIAMPGSIEMIIDSSDFFAPDGTTKLGLGSSAALTVGLMAAVRQMLDRDCSNKQQLLKDSYDLHNHFQGLAGSGIDVAASIYGGVFQYQMKRDASDFAPRVKVMPIPKDLQMRFVWTGQPASTADYLKKMANYRKHNEAKFNQTMQSLANLAGAGCEAFLNGRTDTFFQVVQDYHNRLAQLGAESRIPIISDVHRQIADIVYAGGGFYKPSGAGGGDFGVIFSSSKSHITELAQSVARNGFTTTDINVGAEGIKFSADKGGIHDSIRLPQTV